MRWLLNVRYSALTAEFGPNETCHTRALKITGARIGVVNSVNNWFGCNLAATEETTVESTNGIVTTFDAFELDVNLALAVRV